MKTCENCKHSEETLINDLVCVNDESEHYGEFVRINNLCKCWGDKNVDIRTKRKN